MDLLRIQATLAEAGVVFDEGLRDVEIAALEQRFAFCFPPDLRAFLQHAMPVSGHWMNWRAASEDEIAERLARPIEGMCFDVEENSFWLDCWGERPPAPDIACDVVRTHVAKAPKLIPICANRYVPDAPRAAGNPIFSVYQTDIIVYGADLEDYLANEYSLYFGRTKHQVREPAKPIPFWSQLL